MSDLIDGYVRHLRARGASRDTVRKREIVLRAAAAALPGGLDHPTVNEVEAWLGTEGWSRWTRYTYFEHLHTFYAWATERGDLSWSPTARMRRPPRPRCQPHPASEDQLAIAMRMRRPWRTAVLLAAFDGLRAGEIAALDSEQVTREWLVVERKGGDEGLLPTHELVWAEVRDLPPGPVIRTARGTRFSANRLSTRASEELARAGLPEVTLHWFRHRFATRMLLPRELGGAGADVRTVQELLGHRSLSSTQVYTQVTDRQRRAAIAALPVPVVPMV